MLLPSQHVFFLGFGSTVDDDVGVAGYGVNVDVSGDDVGAGGGGGV
jgi:hypothetical protein